MQQDCINWVWRFFKWTLALRTHLYKGCWRCLHRYRCSRCVCQPNSYLLSSLSNQIKVTLPHKMVLVHFKDTCHWQMLQATRLGRDSPKGILRWVTLKLLKHCKACTWVFSVIPLAKCAKCTEWPTTGWHESWPTRGGWAGLGGQLFSLDKGDELNIQPLAALS